MQAINRGILALCLGLLSLQTPAQNYPSRAVRIIEPAGPGSAVDVFARKLTPGLADKFGQSVVVENRPGGNSSIGAREAARAAPDGHTLFHANINNSLNDILTNDACCRLNEALLPVTLLTLGLFIFIINGLLFWFVASFVPGFHVAGFWSGVLGAMVYSVISWLLSAVLLKKPA